MADLKTRSDKLLSKVKTLLNSDLKAICKCEALPVSGVKATLQARIVERINNLVTSGDVESFNRLFSIINKHGTPLPDPMTNQSPVVGAALGIPTHLLSGSANMSRPGGQYSSHVPPPSKASKLNFRSSPFFVMQEPVTQAIEFTASPNRNTSQTSFSLTQLQADRMKTDKTLRLLVYCALDPGAGTYPIDVAFPGQIELKVNAEAYGGNLRGIKKKPGTTRPADVTDFIRRAPGYQNTVALTHANTDKSNYGGSSKYVFVVYIAKKRTADDLLDGIKHGKKITKETVLREMQASANDADIVATSTVMSLKCPLSTMRMQLPCRGQLCHHNQCFDAMSYLQTQEQAPQWTCPTCNRTCRYEDLAIDQYVQDIIANTSSSIDQVTIEPNGDWRQLKADNGKSQEKQNNMKKQSQVFTLDDDDHVSIYRPSINRAGSVSTSYNTPEASSRAPSTSISTGPRQNKKRPADDVVDLTLDSDDADEEPRRAVKRQSTLPSMTNSTTSLFNPGLSASPSIPGLSAKTAPQLQPRYGFPLPPHNQATTIQQPPQTNYHPTPGFGTYGHQSNYAGYPPS